MNTRPGSIRSRSRLGAAIGSVLVYLLSRPADGQITPDQADQIRNALGNRIEALTILGGDYGLTGGTLRSTGRFQAGESSNAELTVTKLGGSGDIGDPQPLGGAAVGWQPRVQGNLGFLKSSNVLHSPQLEGDINTFQMRAVEFGGGARFWMSDSLSLAPTIMGLYGRTTNSYTANSAFMQANLTRATELGLVGWGVDTWTARAAVNIQYIARWERTIITLSSEPVYYHTETINSSSPNISVHGNSGSFVNKIDLDVPLGMQLFGHELRSGGSFSRTDLFGGLRDGLGTDHINELHGRLVVDVLNQLWKVQWIGFGASYVWGPNVTGWTAGIDVAFRF